MTTAPLSFAQERLWVLHEIDDGVDPYSILTVVRLTGPLDVERLQRAFADLVRRHDAARGLRPVALPAVVPRGGAPRP